MSPPACQFASTCLLVYPVLCCADMVTCVDVCGYTVMSASLDGTVALWDLRSSDEHQTIQAINAAGNETVSVCAGACGTSMSHTASTCLS
jgi:WD40 repeat protein